MDQVPVPTISYAKVVRKDDDGDVNPSAAVVTVDPSADKSEGAEVSPANDPNYEDMDEDESFR